MGAPVRTKMTFDVAARRVDAHGSGAMIKSLANSLAGSFQLPTSRVAA